MEQKPTYEELAQKVTELEQLIDTASDAIYTLAPDTTITFLNLTWERLTGHSRDEWIGKSFGSLVHPEDLPSVKQQFLSALETGSPCRIEGRYRKKDGAYVFGEYSLNCVMEDGVCVAVIGIARDITDRKLAEEALRAREAEVSAILANAPTPMFLVDRDRRIVEVSGAFVELSCRDASALLGMRGGAALRCVHALDDPEGCGYGPSCETCVVRKTVMDTFETGESHRQVEGKVTTGNGNARQDLCFLLSTARLDLQGGQRVLVCVEDITERRRIERAIRRSEKRYRTLVESTSDYIFSLNEQGLVQWVNRAAAGVLGGVPEEIVGRSVFDLFPEELAEEYYQNVTKVFQTGQTMVQESRMHAPPDRELWINTRLNPVEGDDGRTAGVLGICRDVTEHRQTTEALQETLTFSEKILSEAPVGITIYDAVSGKCLAGNRAMARLIGATEEQVLAQNFYAIESWKESGLLETAKRALNEDSRKELDVTVRTTFGRNIAFHCYFVPFWAGERRFLLFTLDDFTERKQMEEQLRQAQKMEAIGTMAGGIAHDFNNILAAVVGSADLAQLKGSMGLGAKEELDQILRSCRRAKDLTTQMLAFSRPVEQKREVFDMASLVKEFLGFVKATLPTTIDIRDRIGPESCPVLADPTQMYQILLNLCTNAGQAMPEGGVLEIVLKPVTLGPETTERKHGLHPGRYVSLNIRDTGSGIAEEHLGRVFDPFFSTKGGGAGTGLGLSVVHGIVKGNGGAISVASRVGEGTELQVLLPLQDSAVAAGVQGRQQSLVSGEGHILFVDDEAPIREMAKGSLELLGYTVSVFSDPGKALEAFADAPGEFDLVITDMTMPGMTGLNLSRKIMKIKADTPVVLCTGHSELITPKNVQEVGIRRVILKPIWLPDLTQVISEMIGGGAGT